MTLYIYTEELFAINRFKNLIKRLLNRRERGPKAVADSLQLGLKELGQAFVVNQKIVEPVAVACALSGVKTLNWAIKQKQKGKIKKIIAGPNIVVFPGDANSVLLDPLIDIIVVPSQWVLELYSELAPEIAGKIRVWPAGVFLPSEAVLPKTLDFLIFNKTGSSELYANIVKYLSQRGYRFKVISYGRFKRQEYFDSLEHSRYMIYLSASESQGLAMFEAWARNVPTLIWENGEYIGQGKSILGKVSAPFLTSEAGLSFSGAADFSPKFESFISASFFPRQYIEKNFSDLLCARKYLKFIYDSKNL